ncbi:phage major capsid protein [Anoxybacteroides tepidamans]|uniref:phage major capsid protein n=1 Tax=Anoxybacteroides tepidamans TaxID=265948 RepID=UPI0004858214|nr:phage major capsid protein [Anoxybacillus tepidamans]
MNKKEYLAKRKALLEAAEKALNEGKLEEFKAKEKEINDLDGQFEDFAKAQANMNALKDKAPAAVVIDMAAGDNGVVASTKPIEVKDEKQIYLNAWAKEMMGQPLAEQEKVVFDKFNADIRNAMQTTATHAVIIPESVREGIWREAGELFPIIGDVRMTFVPGDLTIIKETNAGGDAEWYDEETEVADSEFGFGELNLTGCELAKSIPISWKLRKMSIDAFIPYIQTLLAEKLGAALAKGIVSGLGKPGAGDTFKAQPKGIVTALVAESGTPQIIEYDDTDVLTYDKLAKAMGLIKSAYKSGAVIYAKSTTIWNKLALIKDNQGRPLFVPDVTSGGVGRIFGLPVKEEDSVPDDAILFGNVTRGYVINVNEDMTIYTEDHVKKRYTDYMVYAIVDGDVMTTKAFAYIRKKVQV